MRNSLFIFVLILIANVLLVAQSTVYRINSVTDPAEALASGEEKLVDDSFYWFVYRVELTDGPRIHSNHHELSINTGDNDFSYSVKNRIALQDLYGSAQTEVLENKSYTTESKGSKYFLIFEYRGGNFTELNIREEFDGFNFYGNPIVYGGEFSLENSFTFIDELFEEQKNEDIREDLVFYIYLHHHLEAAFDKLLKIAKSNDYSESTEQAIFWLGNTDAENIPEILDEIYRESNNEDIREKVIFAFHINKSPESLEYLILIATDDSDSEMRQKALFWIGQVATKRSLALLKDTAEKDEDEEVRKSAIFALSQMEGKESVHSLINIALTNPHKSARKSAIFWLSQSEEPEATEFLIKLVKEDL